MSKIWTIVLFLSIPVSIFGYPSQAEIALVAELVPEKDQATLVYTCIDYDIDMMLILRLMYVESSFDNDAVRYENNGTCSKGYFQLNSGSFSYFAEKYYEAEHILGEFNPEDSTHNITVGIAYLYDLYERFGDWETSVMAFNCGCGTVRNGEIPQSSMDYSAFIVSGQIGPDSYLYYRMLEFNRIKDDILLDKPFYISVR